MASKRKGTILSFFVKSKKTNNHDDQDSIEDRSIDKEPVSTNTDIDQQEESENQAECEPSTSSVSRTLLHHPVRQGGVVGF
jgi:hypothetical protein